MSAKAGDHAEPAPSSWPIERPPILIAGRQPTFRSRACGAALTAICEAAEAVRELPDLRRHPYASACRMALRLRSTGFSWTSGVSSARGWLSTEGPRVLNAGRLGRRRSDELSSATRIPVRCLIDLTQLDVTGHPQAGTCAQPRRLGRATPQAGWQATAHRPYHASLQAVVLFAAILPSAVWADPAKDPRRPRRCLS